jgi:hypothetical protein
MMRSGRKATERVALLGRPLLAEETAIRLHRRLQKLADRGATVLRRTGGQQILLAQRH